MRHSSDIPLFYEACAHLAYSDPVSLDLRFSRTSRIIWKLAAEKTSGQVFEHRILNTELWVQGFVYRNFSAGLRHPCLQNNATLCSGFDLGGGIRLTSSGSENSRCKPEI